MKLITKNKKAYHDFEIIESLEAGIILKGHEVKAIKNGQINIKDAIIRIANNELLIINMDIPLYKKTSIRQIGNYNPKWPRKLLITKGEKSKYKTKTDKTGLMLIPLQIYQNKDHRIKLIIWLAKRLKKIMKKQRLKEQDIKRNMEKEIRSIKT